MYIKKEERKPDTGGFVSCTQIKAFLAVVLVAAVLISGCSEDKTVEAQDTSSPVTFRVQEALPASRAAGTTAAYMNAFVVNGVVDQVEAGHNNVRTLFDRTTVSRVIGSGANVFTYSPTVYYPKGATKAGFSAFSPVSSRIVASDFRTSDPPMSTDNIIVYTVPSPAKGSLAGDVDVAPQEDLLVAHTQKDDLSGAVILQFRHALSRVSVRAANLTDQPVRIHSLSLHNLCISGYLDVDKDIWKNPSDGIADINEDYKAPATTHTDYKTLWDIDGQPGKALAWQLAESGVMVPKGGATVQVTADDQALLVLPQTTKNKNNDAIADPGDFYLEVTYTVGNITETIQALFGDINKLAPTPGKDEGLTFEMGRQYAVNIGITATGLRFDISVDDWGTPEEIPEIEPDPDPALYATYTPKPHKGWAGSNIYWVTDASNPNGGYLTFDDVDDDTNKNNQGLFFKWGSLVGISPVGDWSTTEIDPTVLYYPDVANGNYEKTDAYAQGLTAWTDIEVGAVGNRDTDIKAGANQDLRLSGYVTYLNSDPDNLAAFKGDICAYLSGRPGVPKGYWRMPTSAEFEPAYPETFNRSVYQKVVADEDINDTNEFTWSGGASDKPDGSYKINNGRRLTYYGNKEVYFPASAGRGNSDGGLYSPGMSGSAWSSSAGASYGRYMVFYGTTVTPTVSYDRAFGFPVRCVKK